MSVGLLDGFGLTMFLPLLQTAGENDQLVTEELGNLKFLVEGLQSLGINLTIDSILIIILIFFTLKGIAKFVESYYNVLTRQHFIKKIRVENVNKLSSLNYKSFVKADVGRIQNTLSGEVERVSMAYQSYFLSVQAGVMILVYVGMALLANPQFAVLVAIGGAVSNIAFRKLFIKTKETSRKISKDGHTYQSLLIQFVSFYKYLKATGAISFYARKLNENIIKIEANNKKVGFYNSVLIATREPVVVLIVVVVIIIQTTYFSTGLALIILSLLFFYRALNYLMLLQSQWNNFLNVSGSLENQAEFNKELSLNQVKTGGESMPSFKNSLYLHNLGFAYDDNVVLQDVNLKICKNEMIAFVGESGSGKTTLINLISGLVAPTKGAIILDGERSYSEIDVSLFQKRIGYITQDPVIFDDTVYNNVTLWAEETELNKVHFWEALRRAAVKDYVHNLVQGENTNLGNNGVTLSGGQKQRLSIAREIYKDIDILIMDEATSALDSETEKVVQENLEALRGSYTILIVAHRLATIRNADKIVQLENGKISHIGNFDDLYLKSRTFNRMVSLQGL